MPLGLSTPLRNSVEDSHYTVVCFLGVIKSSPSGIHSGAGSVIHLGLVVVLGVRHLIILDIFFQNSIDSSACLSVSTVVCRRRYCDTNGHSHVLSTAF